MNTDNEIMSIVRRWIDLYNTDVHLLIDELYSPDAELLLPGLMSVSGRETLHGIEQSVLDIAPDRRAEVLRSVVDNSAVAVECVLKWSNSAGEQCETPWSAFLDIKDGQVTVDHSYIDANAWPGASAVIESVSRA
ncbi:nuclear transport factor 2 family protein [Mycobacteroides chelonae]